MNKYLKLEPNEIALLSGTSLGLVIAAELNAFRVMDAARAGNSQPIVSPIETGCTAHSANQPNAGESGFDMLPDEPAPVSYQQNAGDSGFFMISPDEPAPVSSDTVAGQPAPTNHDNTGGDGACSPSTVAASFDDEPPILTYWDWVDGFTPGQLSMVLRLLARGVPQSQVAAITRVSDEQVSGISRGYEDRIGWLSRHPDHADDHLTRIAAAGWERVANTPDEVLKIKRPEGTV